MILLIWGATSLAQSKPEQDQAALRTLEKNCFSCHGELRISNLDMRQRESLLKGGTRGPAVVPGKAEESLIYQAAARTGELKMPPQQTGLTREELELLRAWIDAGATWTQGTATSTRKSEPSWWSFRKPVRPPVPEPRNKEWVRNPIDAFVLQKLEEQQLTPVAQADKRVLLRRIYFDLIGLPPTTEELDRFMRDSSPDAYEKVVDFLLASPHYGERWGKHWLDVVRYADTGGYQTDLYYKDAWLYRDYVIASFNKDKPYDRFVQEQIAGDELWPDNLDLHGSYFIPEKEMEHIEARIGTELYTISPVYHESGLDVENYFDMQWTDWVDVTGSAFMGLTLGCSRCHDHKFDPISQRDYFGLRSIFAGSDRVEIPLVHRMDLFDQWQSYPRHIRVQQLRAEAEKITSQSKRRIIESLKGTFPKEVLEAYEIPEGKRSPEQQIQAAKFQEAVGRIKEEEILSKMIPAENEKYKALLEEIGKAYLQTLKPMPTATVLGHAEVIPEIHLLVRGDYRNKGERITPAFPKALREENEVIEETSLRPFVPQRRKALALWLTKPDHPLTARVMVNRLWQGHFGSGLVATPNDFGRQGQPPTHPELLDWLATEFVRQGWSIKRMHRLMVLSNTYRLSSMGNEADLKIDPQNRFLWRMNPRRLEAEAIWDSVLAAAGTLNLKAEPLRYYRPLKQANPALLNEMGGPPVFPPLSQDERDGGDLLEKSQWPDSLDPNEYTRRGVYVYVKRSFSFPMFKTFDAPDSSLSCERRQNTTVAPQSLALMNNEFIHRQARAFALRLLKENGDQLSACIDEAWLIALNRAPTQDEKEKNMEFLLKLEESWKNGTRKEEAENWLPESLRSISPARAEALTKLCLTIFNLNEFLYVD
ncbi:MAG: PSD1 and planctomycete cytochrome C domain-containing protein [Terriglobia bacterium]